MSNYRRGPRAEYGGQRNLRGVYQNASSASQRPSKTNKPKDRVELTTNVWKVNINKNIPIFCYKVQICELYPFRAFKKGKEGSEKENQPSKKEKEQPFREISKNSRGDFLSIDRKRKCLSVYKYLLERERDFFGDLNCLIYDRAEILYSLNKLNVGTKGVKKFDIQGAELHSLGLFSPDCLKVQVQIKYCKDDLSLTTSGFGRSNAENRSLQQFYELLLSQEAFFTDGRFVSYDCGRLYLWDPGEFGFSDTNDLPDGKYIGIGASKATRIIGSKEKPQISVYVDVKKTAFHLDKQKLVDKIRTITGISDPPQKDSQFNYLNKLLKGVFVRCDYGKERVFCISGLTKRSAEEMRLEGERITVAAYFKERYKIILKLRKWPLVIEKTSRGDNYYPVERLEVCENQRVTFAQQTPAQTQKMIRACAAPPYVRYNETLRLMAALELHKSGRENRWCKEINMNLSERSVQMIMNSLNWQFQLEALVLSKPKVVYTGGQSTINDNGTWSIPNTAKYVIPAACECWCAFALVASGDKYKFKKQNLSAYVQSFVTRCKELGMQIGSPVIEECVAIDNYCDDLLNNIFEEAKKKGATFIHFISSDHIDFLHGHIKLLECKTQIVTQDLKLNTALDIQRRKQTLTNIINKTNLKLGGLNFKLCFDPDRTISNHQSILKFQEWLDRKDTVIIGMDFAPLTMFKERREDNEDRFPSVLGYASNSSKHPLNFIGGYRYCWSTRDEVDEGDNSIGDVVEESLRLAYESRGILPKHIILLRDGISEGQYDYVREREVKQIKKGAEAFDPKQSFKITVVVVTKQHCLRLYQKVNGSIAKTNIPPGTVVDNEIVNPFNTEFYLNSHNSMQGTATTPRYNVLYDTSNFSLIELEAFVYALSFDLQIVTLACSLPAPILIADRMAARGHDNFMAKFGNRMPEKRSTERTSENILKSFNDNLSYLNKKLSRCRFEA